MNRVRRRGTTRSVPLLVVAAAMTASSLVPTVARASSIIQTKAAISALTQRLAQQERTSETTANEYDAAKSRLKTIEANIVTLQAKEVTKRDAISVTSRALVVAVVRAYVLGEADAQIIALFDQSAVRSDARTVYENKVVGNLDNLRHEYVTEKASLDKTIHEVAVQRSNAQYQTNRMQYLLAQNIRNEQTTRATLAVLTSSLKKEIISYEIALGTQAARNRDVAQEESAVAAASAVGGQAAANQVLAAIQKATPVTYSGSPAGSAQGMAALHYAESQIGVPYVWGGETPGQGFDCSGLVQWAWSKAGFSIPRTTEEQWPAMRHVPLTALQPGDLLYYYNLDGDHLIDHVVMYAGSGPWGTSTIIAAAHSGTTVSLAPMFTFGLVGAARP
jgi:peptidoglycan DL-endopeptidase CwlO